ncbi:MAG: bifunctional demethylmenaquinone methyltransferase/2-methoxy-6-polyprenyl-1,4-benzoquinol methylase UbiE [Gammaproteobacteria bacterium]|nr:bifunctional demethylmenaquinone methyltransferase/2-methoxy-6-polyprenyl-1,4-benzoquinol methylase UbiE [Gammaproteobacteria bacterium]
MPHPEKKTHFGFESVDWNDKANKVGDVFDSVAERYDIMNDLMSLGIHRLWKRFAIAKSLVRPGHQVLDLAGGSGDITQLLAQKVGQTGRVILADINASMLSVGRDRLMDKGLLNTVNCIQANAEALPFANNQFDCITIGFGLRNVTDKARALQSMYRVCKPGGKLLVLEFSTPNFPGLKPIYDAYSFHVLPKLGEWITKDTESYRYLVESIRMHPTQDALKAMIEDAGFEDCTYHNLSGGIVALHIAYKY